MDGITIVAEHLCRVIEWGELIGFGIFITLLCIGGLLFYRWGYKHCKSNKANKITIFICSIILVIINICFWIVQINKYNTTHIEYTIIVDDSVSFNDFYEKYEIISINEDRYRVIEK